MTVAAALLVASFFGTSPASAAPGDWVGLDHNTLSPQYQLNGCKYKVQYGRTPAPFNNAYATLRFYTSGSGCSTAPGLVWLWYYDDATWTEHVIYSTTFSTHTGTDGCGAYRSITVAASSATFSGRVLIAIGTGGTGIDNSRTYAQTGTLPQSPVSTC